MNSRILPRSEWAKLDVKGSDSIGTTVPPAESHVVVVEEAGEILATVTVVRIVHFEDLWINPKYKGNPGMIRSLLNRAKSVAKLWTDKWVWGASETDQMTDYLKRFGGVQIGVQSFIIPIEGN